MTEKITAERNCNLKTAILWRVTPCNLLRNVQGLVEVCCLLLRCWISSKMEPAGYPKASVNKCFLSVTERQTDFPLLYKYMKIRTVSSVARFICNALKLHLILRWISTRYGSWISSSCTLLQSSVTSSLLGPNMYLSTPFSNTLSQSSSFDVTELHTHTNQQTKLQFRKLHSSGPTSFP